MNCLEKAGAGWGAVWNDEGWYAACLPAEKAHLTDWERQIFWETGNLQFL